MIKIINTSKAPPVVGPYSQAIVVNNFVFCSGQIGLDPKTKQVVVGIENQTRQVMKNLQEVLEKAGSNFNYVVKTTIFLSDMNNYAKVNEIYGSFFPRKKPARSTVEVSRLPRNVLVEIEAIAYKPRRFSQDEH